jgi:NAD(P)-dependent dehydrogenase (short-subunit alcohol dehydrogenase family)
MPKGKTAIVTGSTSGIGPAAQIRGAADGRATLMETGPRVFRRRLVAATETELAIPKSVAQMAL